MVVVAHRLSTVRHADCLVVLKVGSSSSGSSSSGSSSNGNRSIDCGIEYDPVGVY